jgi:hypothetical protein
MEGDFTSLRRLFALSAIALNIRPKGLPDSSDPIRQDGLQGQVLAITIHYTHSPTADARNLMAPSHPSLSFVHHSCQQVDRVPAVR